MAAQASFTVDTDLTGLANAYRNEAFIADQVLPVVPVMSEVFAYSTLPQGETFTIPDDRVGRKGQPNEVEFSQTQSTSQTRDYGLQVPLPYKDRSQMVEDAYDHQARATRQTTELLLLAREKRVADLVFTASNYPTGNKLTLSGSNQWSNSSSDPQYRILTTMDSMVMRPNILVISQAVYTQLRMHPKLIQAFNRNEGQEGGALSSAWMAAYFEVERLLVARAWYNTAVQGQDPSIRRLWGKHAALLHVNPDTTSQEFATSFGALFEWRPNGTSLEVRQWEDPKLGARGGSRYSVVTSYKELVIASDFGYLFSNAVA